MSDVLTSTQVPANTSAAEPGGFAKIPRGLVMIWAKLPEHFTRLLPALLSFASGETGCCFPSHDRLAALVGRSRRSVWDTLHQMEAAGMLTITQRADPKRRNANSSCLYSLANLDDPAVRHAVLVKLSDRLAVKLKTSQPSCAVQDFTAKPLAVQSKTSQGDVKSNTSQGLCSLGLHTNLPGERTSKNGPEEGAGAPGAGRSAPAATSPAALVAGAAEEAAGPHTHTRTAGSKPVAAKKRTGGRRSSTPPTPGEVAAICSSAKNMELYLTYGKEKVFDPAGEYPPSGLNWRAVVKDMKANPITPESLAIDEWKIPHFVGFFWYRVSVWRGQRRIQQGMPKYERLCGDMKNLLNQLGGKWPLFQYINTLCWHFDLFCCMAGRIGENMVLDESSLTHSTIRNLVQQFVSVGPAQQDEIRLRHLEGTKAREARYGIAA